VWAWGQGIMSGPHDAQLLENGNILILDNGLGTGVSRAIEVDPMMNEIVWEYKADPPEDFYTESKGSVQRLPNGNTLITDSVHARVFEVTRDGEIVWDYICPYKIEPGKRPAIARAVLHPVPVIDDIVAKHAREE
jgi:hypothetical protein